jgi:hypothetical protein
MNSNNKGVFELHSTDRQLYRRCRRKWNWGSSIRENLTSIGPANSALWFGTGIHFALEDYHGTQKYGGTQPIIAFNQFVECFKEEDRPDNWPELQYLAAEILTYYVDTWHDIYFKQYRTATLRDMGKTSIDGFDRFGGLDEPLVEAHFVIPLSEEYVYAGTFDRIVIDQYDRFWVVDVKTARSIDTVKLENDPQASAYAWAASKFFGIEFEGVIWLQISKDVPDGPKQLVSGEFSQNKQAKTTYRLYHKALMDTFGEIPERYIDHLNYLVAKEIENGDKFIHYDLLRRNQSWIDAEQYKIMAELQEMSNPNLQIYPNPTKDCMWDCPFRSACLAYDDGSDFQYILDHEFMVATDRHAWRQLLPER